MAHPPSVWNRSTGSTAEQSLARFGQGAEVQAPFPEEARGIPDTLSVTGSSYSDTLPDPTTYMTMPHGQWRSASAFLIGSVLISASLAVAQQPTPPPSKPAVDSSTMDLEQLMKIEIVVAGSKRAQQSRDVASFVSVVSAAEIREHGYRTLADVLRTLPGFYVSNDRNYSYIGVRGFSRPGDWNSRILLLLNGVRTNESVYDLAYIGEEFQRRCGPDRAGRSHTRAQFRALRKQRFLCSHQRRHETGKQPGGW